MNQFFFSSNINFFFITLEEVKLYCRLSLVPRIHVGLVSLVPGIHVGLVSLVPGIHVGLVSLVPRIHVGLVSLVPGIHVQGFMFI